MEEIYATISPAASRRAASKPPCFSPLNQSQLLLRPAMRSILHSITLKPLYHSDQREWEKEKKVSAQTDVCETASLGIKSHVLWYSQNPWNHLENSDKESPRVWRSDRICPNSSLQIASSQNRATINQIRTGEWVVFNDTSRDRVRSLTCHQTSPQSSFLLNLNTDTYNHHEVIFSHLENHKQPPRHTPKDLKYIHDHSFLCHNGGPDQLLLLAGLIVHDHQTSVPFHTHSTGDGTFKYIVMFVIYIAHKFCVLSTICCRVGFEQAEPEMSIVNPKAIRQVKI